MPIMDFLGKPHWTLHLHYWSCPCTPIPLRSVWCLFVHCQGIAFSPSLWLLDYCMPCLIFDIPVCHWSNLSMSYTDLDYVLNFFSFCQIGLLISWHKWAFASGQARSDSFLFHTPHFSLLVSLGTWHFFSYWTEKCVSLVLSFIR